MRSVGILAQAKVNLWLRVLARETTGYHSLETLFVGISLADEIEIQRESSGVRLEVTGEVDTGPQEKNLAYRAASHFLERAGIREGVSIRLAKAIPSQAGLGGGSADCAATLRGMNELFEAPLSPRELRVIGAQLGSDVSFFLSPTPMALAWGRGERLLACQPLPSRQVLVAHPGEGVPTPASFARLAELRLEAPPREPDVVTSADLSRWDTLAGRAANDLYVPALERIPRLAAADVILREAGAEISLLAGSGASMFGTFALDKDLGPVIRSLEDRGFRCWAETTIQEWALPGMRD